MNQTKEKAKIFSIILLLDKVNFLSNYFHRIPIEKIIDCVEREINFIKFKYIK